MYYLVFECCGTRSAFDSLANALPMPESLPSVHPPLVLVPGTRVTFSLLIHISVIIYLTMHTIKRWNTQNIADRFATKLMHSIA